MNINALGLQLVGFGLKPLQGGRADLCLNHGLQHKMPIFSAKTKFRNQLPLTNSPLCSRSKTPASAFVDQTDSPEPIRFGYFPL